MSWSIIARFGLALLLFHLTPTIYCAGAPPASGIKHILLVMEENHSYSQVIGNVNEMPYLNSLANSGGLATNYYGVTHPSIGNYFTITTGQIITNNDGYTATVDVDNIVRQILAAGLTWKDIRTVSRLLDSLAARARPCAGITRVRISPMCATALSN